MHVVSMKLGNPARLTGTFKNAAGGLTNPSAVEARIKQPDGTTITATPTNASTGVYTYDFTPTQTGVHSYAMQGTSGLIAADGGEFTVYPLEA